MFSKRHYEALAEVLRVRRPRMEAPDRPAWLAIVEGMADTFARDNPRFDRKRFIFACGVGE